MTPMLSIAYQPTEPEESNPEPVTDTIEDILHSLDISEAQGRSEAQEAEQQAIDEIFLDTLNSLDAIEWPIDELGEAETDELLRASEGEEEKEVTMEEQPPNIIEAPFSCVDIRTKSESARKASLKSISDKLARRRSAPRRPPVYAAACKRPTANYPPPVTADNKHTEGEARPPKIPRLMSITIKPTEVTLPPYSPSPTQYYAANYDKPLPENRKRRFENPARQPLSGCYMPRHKVGEGWDGLWFCREPQCGVGNTSKKNRKCRKCWKRYSILETPEKPVV